MGQGRLFLGMMVATVLWAAQTGCTKKYKASDDPVLDEIAQNHGYQQWHGSLAYGWGRLHNN